MRVSIVGLGKMGLLHAAIVNSLDANVTAVCETDLFLSTAAKAFLPKSVSVYRDATKMITEEDPDATFITTPIDTHAAIIGDLMKAKNDLSIFAEKPLAATYEQAKAACEATSRSRGVHMVGFQRRYSPVYRRAQELLLNGAVGEPIFFRAYVLSSDVLREGRAWRSKRASGGVLLDLAPHLLDVLLWFFGEPSRVQAVKKPVYSSEVEDYVHAILSYNSNLQGNIDVCWSASNYRLPEVLIEVHGKDGMLTVTDDYVKLALGKRAEGKAGSQTEHKQSLISSVPFQIADPEYTMEDVAFLEGAWTRTQPLSNFAEAAKVNALIDRILERDTPGKSTP